MNDNDRNEYYRKYMNVRYHERMNMARERLGGKCVICGSESDLEIDHIDPVDKSFTIASGWNKPLPIFFAEVDKCELRCAEHHREKHAAPHGTWRRYKSHGCRCDKCVEWWTQYKVAFNITRNEKRRRKLRENDTSD